MFKCSNLFACLTLAVHILLCQGYMYLQPVKFGEGECFDDDWISHQIGSVWYDNSKCEKSTCILSKGILYIRVYGCSKIGYSDGCRLVPGKAKNYPKCCPQVECSDLP